jgi:hypothetical protein
VEVGVGCSIRADLDELHAAVGPCLRDDDFELVGAPTPTAAAPAASNLGLGRHGLVDQPGELDDASSVFAAADDPGVVHARRQRSRPASPPRVVRVLDAHRSGGRRQQRRVTAAARLDGGLLVGADDVVALAQRLTVPDAA